MGLTKNEAELKQLATEFKNTLAKVQASGKEGVAVAKKPATPSRSSRWTS